MDGYKVLCPHCGTVARWRDLYTFYLLECPHCWRIVAKVYKQGGVEWVQNTW